MENLAGLYLHIPFCRRKCAYCDFYSKAQPKLIKPYVDALCQEMETHKDYLDECQPYRLRTIYFGGGTPSLLQASDFQQIFQTIEKHFDLSRCEEITLEANPDDLSETYLASLRDLPFNRLSIGIQSFNDHELAFIKRRHNAQDAIAAAKRAQDAGFRSISIDLMASLPFQTLESFADSVAQAIALKPQHISAYLLGLEPEVPLSKSLAAGLWKECDEETSIAMYDMLCQQLTAAGYEHYEISNFALPGHRSRHNSAYWSGLPYLGLGPSAHSYNGRTRRWNAADLKAYIAGEQDYEEEILSLNDRFNDLILTRLRTCEGLNLIQLEEMFGKTRKEDCLKNAKPFIENGQMQHKDDWLRILPSAYALSDNIIRELLEV